MNSHLAPSPRLARSTGRSAALGAVLLLSSWMGAMVHAQTLYIASPNGTNGVSSYNIDGTLINSSLIPGSSYQGLALTGSTLFVTNPGTGTVNNGAVGAYTLNATGGVASSAPFFASGIGVTAPFGLAATSTNLYVADFNSGNILRYTLGGIQDASFSVGLTNPFAIAISGDTLWISQATGGAGANTVKGYSLSTFTSTPTFTLTTGLSTPEGLAVFGSTLYVANEGSGSITTFNTVTGVSTGTFISGLSQPHGVTVYGSSLFVTSGDGTVKGFDALTGTALAGFTTIIGLGAPNGIVVGTASAIPEPSTYAAIAGASMLGLAVWQRRRKTVSPASATV